MVFMGNNKQHIIHNQTTFISDTQSNCSAVYPSSRAVVHAQPQLDPRVFSANVHRTREDKAMGRCFLFTGTRVRCQVTLWAICTGRKGRNEASFILINQLRSVNATIPLLLLCCYCHKMFLSYHHNRFSLSNNIFTIVPYTFILIRQHSITSSVFEIRGVICHPKFGFLH
jgi:hypothetical protein